MKVTIEIPDNCELKQEDGKYIIVEKKVAYNNVAKELFKDGYYYLNTSGHIVKYTSPNIFIFNQTNPIYNINNASSKKQLQKLLAINKLMNVAKYLNGDWQPDWNERCPKWYIEIWDKERVLNTILCYSSQRSAVYFKTEELAKQAIEILGEETIRLALCTDY